jgi:hypothetical protein
MDMYEEHFKKTITRMGFRTKELYSSSMSKCADFMVCVDGTTKIIFEITSLKKGKTEKEIEKSFNAGEAACWDAHVEPKRIRRKIFNKCSQIENTNSEHGGKLPTVLILYDGRPPTTTQQAKNPEHWLLEIAGGMYGKYHYLLNLETNEMLGKVSGKTDLNKRAKCLSAIGTFLDTREHSDILVLYINPYATNPIPVDILAGHHLIDIRETKKAIDISWC